MDSGRRLEILGRMSYRDRPFKSATTKLCEICTEITAVSGAGIMLMDGQNARGTVCTTDSVSAQIEELQYTLGEGPCLDAYYLARTVSVPDLTRLDANRWAAFGPGALDAGARAVFGFPITVGSVRLGALDLYRDQPGPLTHGQHEDAVLVSNMVGRALLLMQAEAPPGGIAPGVDAGTSLRRVVHQASGMVAVQLDVSVATALVSLRAAAFGSERSIIDIAEDVVARRLRLG